MPANDFEKQVQQKMEELQLRPSGEVWVEVEKRIRKERRRRGGIIWFVFVGLLLAGGSTWYLMHNDQKERNNAPSISHAATTNERISNPSDKTMEGSKPIVSKPVELPSVEKPVPGTPGDALTHNRNSSSQTFLKLTPASDHSSSDVLIQTQTTTANKATKKVKPVSTATKGEKSQPDVSIINPATTNQPLQAGVTTIRSIKTDSVNKERAATIVDSLVVMKAATTSEVDSAITLVEKVETIRISKKNKWEWGIALSPGVSHTMKGDLFAAKKSNLAGSPLTSGGVNSLAPFAPAVLIESPRQGFSFDVQLYAQKSLSKKLKLVAGVFYTYLSTEVKVGNKVQGSRQVVNDISTSVVINSYYGATAAGANNAAEYYTNQFHIAGISAGISIQLVDKKKFSLSWDNSLRAGRLFSTNALLYDGGLRGYYEDYNAFQKTQAFVSTGLSAPVFRTRPFTLSVSPFASYSLSPVLKNNNTANSHLFSYGIGLKFSMK